MDIAGNFTFQKIAFLPTAKIWIITNLDNRKISKTFGLEQFNGSDNKDIWLISCLKQLLDYKKSTLATDILRH